MNSKYFQMGLFLNIIQSNPTIDCKDFNNLRYCIKWEMYNLFKIVSMNLRITKGNIIFYINITSDLLSFKN